jgi:hypothetical protein
MNLTVTKDKVVEAASKCSTANQVLRVMFPEAFEPEKPEPFKFGREHTINVNTEGVRPLMIGTAVAPSELREKCLVVGLDFRMETQYHNGYTILTFYTK